MANKLTLKPLEADGFTLIELVIVITLMGSVGFMVAQMMTKPFQQYQDASRRAEMASLTNAAVNRMAIDLENAVPNSVRVTNDGGVSVLELFLSVDAGRYRYSDDTSDTDATGLAPGYIDSSFHVLGGFKNITSLDGSRLIVNPFETSVLYRAANGEVSLGMITPAGMTFALTDAVTDGGGAVLEQRVVLNPATFRFDFYGNGAKRKQVYVMNTPVTYRCDKTLKTLHRYTDYTPAITQATSIPTGSSGALVLNDISACEFLYNTGISLRLGVATLHLQIEQNNEAVSLVKQVRVFNVL